VIDVTRIVPLVAALLLVPVLARGDAPADLVDGYCDWVTGAGLSERALLQAPDAVVAVSRDLLTSNVRFRAGLSYDAVRFYRGSLVERRAEAECDRFRASSSFMAEVELGSLETRRSALAARLSVFEEALPRARELVDSASTAFAAGHATIEELQAIRLRADALSLESAATSTELDALGEPSAPLRATRLRELLTRQVEHEREVETLEGRLRRAGAFRLALNAGYEGARSLSRSVPAYAVLEVSYNLGGARQPRADARALDGRGRWAEAREGGTQSRSARTLLQLRAELASERKRLGEIVALRADVEERWKSLDGIEGNRVRRVRDHLWFDLVLARAQEAFADTRVRDLEVALDDAGADDAGADDAGTDDAAADDAAAREGRDPS